MAELLTLYPVLSSIEIDKLGVQLSPFVFTCSEEMTDPASNEASWPGPVTFGNFGSWTPEKYDLSVNITVVINHPNLLFGPDAFACKNSELNLSLIWASKDSNQRGVGSTISLRKSSAPFEGTLSAYFPAGMLRGKVFLSLRLFIGVPDSNPVDEEKHLANRTGVCIGELFRPCMLIFDGKGSLFPLIETSGKPGDPLWRMNYKSDDPLTDPFSTEKISLELNTSHPDYPYIDSEGEDSGSSPLMRNITASWLSLFFVVLRENEGELFDNLKEGKDISDMEYGSIAYFARYLLQTFNIRTDKSEELHASMLRVVNEILPSKENL